MSMKRFIDNNRFMYVVMAATVLLVLSIMLGFSMLLDQDRDGETDGGEEGSYSYHVAMVSGDRQTCSGSLCTGRPGPPEPGQASMWKISAPC